MDKIIALMLLLVTLFLFYSVGDALDIESDFQDRVSNHYKGDAK